MTPVLVLVSLLCLELWHPSLVVVASLSANQTALEGSGGGRASNSSSTLYLAPVLCPSLTCPDQAAPSSFLYLDFPQKCSCSAPLAITLLLTSPPFANFTTNTSTLLRQRLANEFDLTSAQVWVTSANATANGSQALVDLQFFPVGTTPWRLGQVAVILAELETNSSLLGPRFGPASVAASSFEAMESTRPTPPPPPTPGAEAPPAVLPPPPPPKEGKSGLPEWAIGYIAIGSTVALLAVGLLIWWLLARRPNEVNWYKNPLSNARQVHKTSRPKAQAKSPSSFVQKVQEYFVKEIRLEEILKATDNFSEAKVLGVGGYGTVYKGLGPDGTEWAVKRAKKKANTGVEDFQNEVDVISKMSHRNLVRLLGYCDEQTEQILVYEFVSNGNLREHIHEPDRLQRHVLTFQQRLEIAIGAAEGLRYLHSFAKPPIIHRDVKSDNILLDNEMQAKVADFGVFKHLQASGPPGSTVNTKVVGTPGYLDPEYYQTYKVTPKSDVYSFGVVLLELLTGHPSIMSDPASGNKNVMVTLARWAIPKIVAGKVESIIDPNLVDFPRQAVQMLGSVAAMCVRRSGKERPEMAEVATRLNEIKYFIQPSSGLLEPVHFDEELDALGSIPEFIPGVPTESSVLTGSSAEQNTAPVSMVFSDR